MGHSTALQSRHFADTVHKLQPECLISGRVWNSEGDFSETGDDDIPDYITDEPWESPSSFFSETWGYRSWQKLTPLEGKIHEEILRLVKVTSHGGNYLLNIGPKGDGSVVDYEADVLRGTGEWLRRNGEAIYATNPQPFRKLDFGYASVKGDRLFLFVEHLPNDGRLRLPGLQTRIIEARWLNSKTGGELRLEDRDIIIKGILPKEFLPVVAVRLDGEVKVEPEAILANETGAIHLIPKDADKLFNNNGEGYYDPPTLRSERWHIAVKRSGAYQVELIYKPGPFARIVDVRIGNQLLKATLYGKEGKSSLAGELNLRASDNLTVSVEPGSPAIRGAKLDLEIMEVSLKLIK